MTIAQVKQLKPGDRVHWKDPDHDLGSITATIQSIHVQNDLPDAVVRIEWGHGSELECYAHELSLPDLTMATYIVEKRIINNYLVEVEASTPEEAIRKAYDNEHEPGEPTNENEDGDTFYPSEWRVYESEDGWEHGAQVPVIRTDLKDLD